MFHVEQAEARGELDPPGFLARARQWESEVSILLVFRAPFYQCASDLSSLFCTNAQNYFMLHKSSVDPVPTLVVYAQSLGMSRTIWARPGIKFGKARRRL